MPCEWHNGCARRAIGEHGMCDRHYRQDWSARKARAAGADLPSRLRPFSFQPVQEMLEARLPAELTNRQARTQAVNELAGLDHKEAWRYRRSGLTCYAADKVATRLGLHACLIWLDWWDVCAQDVG